MFTSRWLRKNSIIITAASLIASSGNGAWVKRGYGVKDMVVVVDVVDVVEGGGWQGCSEQAPGPRRDGWRRAQHGHEPSSSDAEKGARLISGVADLLLTGTEELLVLLLGLLKGVLEEVGVWSWSVTNFIQYIVQVDSLSLLAKRIARV
jgi:hypothetical protein